MTNEDETMMIFEYEGTFDLTLNNGEKVVVYGGRCPIDHTHALASTGERFYVNGIIRTVRMADLCNTERASKGDSYWFGI